MADTPKRDEYADKFLEAANNWALEKLYADLRDAKQKLATGRNKLRLTPVEKACLRGLLCGKSPDEIATELFRGAKGLRVDLSRGLYRYVEELTGREAANKLNWRDIAEWLEDAGYKTPSRSQVWGEAPDVEEVFYGRTSELDILKQWIVKDRCRIVALLGIVGIGKTTLATKLAREIADDFDHVIWRSLSNATSLNDLLTDSISFLSPQQSSNLRENTQEISYLMEYIRNHRCLVVLDGWEEYEGDGQLLRRVGECDHESCLVLTSQEKPAAIALLEGRFVRSLTMDSLGTAAREILQKKELSDPQDWPSLIDRYGGNPLLLKLVAEDIKDVFGGSVSKFLDQGTELGVVVPDMLRDLLEQQFQRLSDIQKKIICCLAINRRPVSIENLQQKIKQTYISQLTVALSSLKRRSLIEVTSLKEGESGFTLQPVVMKYVLREQKVACDRLLQE